MLPCINLTYCDECDIFYDLDEEELEYLWADEEGVCMEEYENCYHYEPYLDEEE